MRKKILAPHQKKVSITRNGMMDQAISSRKEPWMGSGISSPRRRYLIGENENHSEDQHRHHDAYQREVDVQVIDLRRDRRSGFGPKWKLHRLD